MVATSISRSAIARFPHLSRYLLQPPTVRQAYDVTGSRLQLPLAVLQRSRSLATMVEINSNSQAGSQQLPLQQDPFANGGKPSAATQAAQATKPPSFYKRPLPPTCIAFDSPEGKKLFGQAMVEGNLEGYFSLANSFLTQNEVCVLASLKSCTKFTETSGQLQPAYCGLAVWSKQYLLLERSLNSHLLSLRPSV